MSLQQRWDEHKVLFGIYMVGFLDLLAVSLIIPILPKHLESLGASKTVIGFIASLYGVLQLISSPVVGKLSDVYGRRQLLLIVLLSCSCSYMLFGLTNTLWIFFLFRIPSGLLKHSLTLGRTCIADVSSEVDRPGRMGLYNAISSIGFVIGPALGGNLMATSGGFKLAVTMTALVFFLNFIVSWWLVHPNQHTTDTHTSSDDKFSLKDSIAFIRSETWPKVSSLMLERFIMSVSVMMLRSNFSLFLEHKFNAGPQIIGYITSFSGIIAFASAMTTGWVTRLYTNESQLLFHSALLMVAAQIGVNFASHISLVFILLVPLGFGTSMMRVVTAHLSLQKVSSREKGEVIGMGQSIASLARIISPQLAGLAMEHSTELPGTIGIAFAALASGLLYKRTLYRVEQKKDK